MVLDSTRAKTIYPLIEQGKLPALQLIAEEGVSFTSAFTTSPWTLPSHASMFTGQRASDHQTHAGTKRFDPDVPTIAESLSEVGYETAGISGNAWVSRNFGFDRGFDNLSMKWDYYWTDADLSSVSAADSISETVTKFREEITPRELPKTVVNAAYGKYLSKSRKMGGKNTTRRAKKWIANRSGSDDPFFFFINYLEPHLEYWPPERYRKMFLSDGINTGQLDKINQDPWEYIAGQSELTEEDFELLAQLYAGEIAYVDALIGQLYQTLEECGLLEETCLVITGDHGENIGDHGLMDHQYSLYDTLLHVPLIIQSPEVFSGGTQVSEFVEVRDIYPTILDLAGQKPPSRADVSTHNLVQGEYREFICGEYRAPQPSMDSMNEKFEEFPELLHQYDRTLRCIRSHKWKVIEGSDGTVELYDVSSDPVESRNIADQNDDVVREHIGRMDQRNVALAYRSNEKGSIDEKSRERLENLGYI